MDPRSQGVKVRFLKNEKYAETSSNNIILLSDEVIQLDFSAGVVIYQVFPKLPKQSSLSVRALRVTVLFGSFLHLRRIFVVNYTI